MEILLWGGRDYGKHIDDLLSKINEESNLEISDNGRVVLENMRIGTRFTSKPASILEGKEPIIPIFDKDGKRKFRGILKYLNPNDISIEREYHVTISKSSPSENTVRLIEVITR